MLELSPSRGANLLALLAMPGIVLAVYLIISTGGQLAAKPGLFALHVSPQNDVLFVAGPELYHLDGQGRLLARIEYASLGVEGGVAALAQSRDGTVLLLNHDARLYGCVLAQRQCTEMARLPLDGRGNAYSLAIGADNGQLLIADSKGHAIHVAQADGTTLYRMTPEDGFRYPNDLSLSGGGQLLVADTNRHRVLLLQDDGNGHATTLEALPIHGPRPGHDWPIAARRDSDGYTWVITANSRLEKGALLLYEPGATTAHPVALEQTDPVALALLDEALLVADYRHRLLHIDPHTYQVREFGEPEVQQALHEMRTERLQWEQTRTLGQGLAGLMLLVGLWAGWLDFSHRRAARASVHVARPVVSAGEADIGLYERAAAHGLRPDVRGIVWLTVSRDFLRNIRLLSGVGVVMLLAGIVPFVVMTKVSLPLELQVMLPLMLLLVLWAQSAFTRIAIGSDGRHLYITDPFGRKAQGLPEAFVIAGRRLIMGAVSVPMANRDVQVFDARVFDAVMGPLLARCERIGHLDALFLQLRERDPVSWGSLLLIALSLAWFLGWFG